MNVMSKKSIIITLGILIAIMPILGFPGTFKTITYVLSGLIIVFVAYFS